MRNFYNKILGKFKIYFDEIMKILVKISNDILWWNFWEFVKCVRMNFLKILRIIGKILWKYRANLEKFCSNYRNILIKFVKFEKIHWKFGKNFKFWEFFAKIVNKFHENCKRIREIFLELESNFIKILPKLEKFWKMKMVIINSPNGLNYIRLSLKRPQLLKKVELFQRQSFEKLVASDQVACRLHSATTLTHTTGPVTWQIAKCKRGLNLNSSANVGAQGDASCIVWYRDILWSYGRFHIKHTSFETTLTRTKMIRVNDGVEGREMTGWWGKG